MRKKQLTCFFLLAIWLSFSVCRVKKETGGKTDEFFPVYTDPAFVIEKKHGLHIDSAFITGDVLTLMINYSGGCKKHFYEMKTNGAFTKSLPPQLYVFIGDTVKTDRCRQFVQEAIKFDLTRLRHPTQKKIILKLSEEHSIIYSY